MFWDVSTFIGQYLVSDSDRDEFRAWLRQYPHARYQRRGMGAKPGDSDEQKSLRDGLVSTRWGTTPAIQRLWKKRARLATRHWTIPRRSISEMAGRRFALAALNGDSAFYDKV